MKGSEKMLVQISSGQGPEECQIAVGKLFNSLKDEFKDIEMVSLKNGDKKDYFHSIIFETNHDLSFLQGSVLWICKSPIRENHKRKNWFIDVSIIPEKETISKEEDYKIEKFHCGGKGGQNVNKVETGVRVIHIPTGITVTSTEERSQFMNKQKAIKRLQGILTALEKENNAKQTNQAWKEHYELVRGNPVRTYEGINFKLKKE